MRGDNAGAVYVFKKNGDGIWNETAKILPEISNQDWMFGVAVYADGARVIVSAPVSC